MRWTRGVAVSISLTALVAAVANLSCGYQPPATTTAEMTPEQKLERGRYMVKSNACNDCHTPGTLYGAADTTRFLSGTEIGWVGPWGVVYARNLTPDSTGLAAWTVEQIATAIRTGNRPDGRQLAPIMPWQNFANLTEEDALCMAAYLKSLPPIVHQVPEPVPPGQKVAGSLVTFPPPPAWDAKNLPPPPTP